MRDESEGQSVRPGDDDGDGVCNLLEVYVPDAVRILWICCFPILLLLLLLLWVINPFTVREEEILGPEPEYTTTEFGWEGGTGEYDDPYILKPVKGIRKGSFERESRDYSDFKHHTQTGLRLHRHVIGGERHEVQHEIEEI
ncbi:MAG: hypothetical protein Ct9H90mP24_6160 [Methanobacteriota archaeon]|nr:MAG: hypothetical protein Ct9H90mP24_6160 [Euryarchaeota archaeon]